MKNFDAQSFLNELLSDLACTVLSIRVDLQLKNVSYFVNIPMSYSEFLHSVSALIQQVYDLLSGESLPKAVCYTRTLELLHTLNGESAINVYLDMVESGYLEWSSFQQICVDHLKQQILSEQTFSLVDSALMPLDYPQRIEVSHLIGGEYSDAGCIFPPHYRSNNLKQIILQFKETRQQLPPLTKKCQSIHTSSIFNSNQS